MFSTVRKDVRSLSHRKISGTLGDFHSSKMQPLAQREVKAYMFDCEELLCEESTETPNINIERQIFCQGHDINAQFICVVCSHCQF